MTELQKSIEKITKQTGKNKTDVILHLLQEQTSLLDNVEDKIRGQLSYADVKKLIKLLNDYPNVSLDDKIFAEILDKGEKRKHFTKNVSNKAEAGQISVVKVYAQEYREKLAVYEALMQELLNQSSNDTGSNEPNQPGNE